jgi:adenine-specific DNA-methyltransferase
MKSEPDYTKLRGGYYTPAKITEFISKWAINNASDSVLEPSCGDGAFINAIINRIHTLNNAVCPYVIGVEVDPAEAKKAAIYGAHIINDDFFAANYSFVEQGKRFDCIIGNPPFIRYQNFPEESRSLAFEQLSKIGIRPTRLMNIWVPFLILSSELLTPTGKLGMVVPAELLQTDYASEARNYLAASFRSITIITFDKLIWQNAQQEIVLILAEKSGKNSGIKLINLSSIDDLNSIQIERVGEYEPKDYSGSKWIKYFLNSTEYSLMDNLIHDNRLTSTKELFEINVGIVSGQNDFFLVNKDTINKYKLTDIKPIVGRADQLSGIIFSNDDLEAMKNKNKDILTNW